MDSKGRIFVADRGNSRVQIFDQNGTLLDQWRQFGRPEVMTIKNDMLYVTDSQSGQRLNAPYRRGIRIGSVNDGIVRYIHSGHGEPTEQFERRSRHRSRSEGRRLHGGHLWRSRRTCAHAEEISAVKLAVCCSNTHL